MGKSRPCSSIQFFSLLAPMLTNGGVGDDTDQRFRSLSIKLTKVPYTGLTQHPEEPKRERRDVDLTKKEDVFQEDLLLNTLNPSENESNRKPSYKQRLQENLLFQNLCSNSTETENSSSETKLNLEGSHYLKFINRQTDNVGVSTTRDDLTSREQLMSNRKSLAEEDKKVDTNTRIEKIYFP